MMTLFNCVAAVIVTCFLAVSTSQAQGSIQALLDQISTDSNAVAAERQLESRGAADAATRRFLSDRLPSLLVPTQNDRATLLFVQLAGDLKLVRTIPALSVLLTERRYHDMATTLYRQAELLDDPVGAALARIGDPSVFRVSGLLQSSDSFTRQRAIRVLYKIGTPNAMEALRNAGLLPEKPPPQ